MASDTKGRKVVVIKGTGPRTAPPPKGAIMSSDAKSRKVVVIKGTGPRTAPPKLWDPRKPPGGKLPKSKPSSEKR